jgi:hypothetical protein
VPDIGLIHVSFVYELPFLHQVSVEALLVTSLLLRRNDFFTMRRAISIVSPAAEALPWWKRGLRPTNR